jgi:hypothetical protein
MDGEINAHILARRERVGQQLLRKGVRYEERGPAVRSGVGFLSRMVTRG